MGGGCHKGAASVKVGLPGVRTSLGSFWNKLCTLLPHRRCGNVWWVRVRQLSHCSQMLLLPLGILPLPAPACVTFSQSQDHEIWRVLFLTRDVGNARQGQESRISRRYRSVVCNICTFPPSFLTKHPHPGWGVIAKNNPLATLWPVLKPEQAFNTAFLFEYGRRTPLPPL